MEGDEFLDRSVARAVRHRGVLLRARQPTGGRACSASRELVPDPTVRRRSVRLWRRVQGTDEAEVIFRAEEERVRNAEQLRQLRLELDGQKSAYRRVCARVHELEAQVVTARTEAAAAAVKEYTRTQSARFSTINATVRDLRVEIEVRPRGRRRSRRLASVTDAVAGATLALRSATRRRPRSGAPRRPSGALTLSTGASRRSARARTRCASCSCWCGRRSAVRPCERVPSA